MLGAGVFLAGLELMITAVALPSILADLADWTQLRHASWIVNGYLLVYVITIPLAGRAADVWGARRPVPLRPRGVHAGIVPGRPSPDARRADRRAPGPGPRRRHPDPRRDGRSLPPVRGVRASQGTRRHRRADVPRHGCRTIRRRGRPGGDPRPDSAGAAGHHHRSPRREPRALVAVGVLRQRADRPHRPRGGVGRERRLGDAAASVGPGPAGRAVVQHRPRGAARRADTASTTSSSTRLLDPSYTPAILLLVAVVFIGAGDRQRPPSAGPVPRRQAVPRPGVQLGSARVAADRATRFATAIVGGAVFVDRVLYGGPDQQRVALGALAGATAIGALVSGLAVRLLSLRAVSSSVSLLGIAALWRMSGWTPSTSVETVALGLGAFGLGLRAHRHAAVDGRGRGSRPEALRHGLGDRDRRPDDRHGDRPLDPRRVRLDDDRTPQRHRSMRLPTRTSSSCPSSCAIGR